MFHVQRFVVPVLAVSLKNAECVDPKVIYPKLTCHSNRILEDFWQLRQCETVQSCANSFKVSLVSKRLNAVYFIVFSFSE